MLVVEAKSTNYEYVLAHEKLTDMVAIYHAKDFDEALKIQKELLKLGPGHTSSLFVDEIAQKDKIDKFCASANTGRLVINSPSSLGGVGDFYNFKLLPTLTIGCGSVGGNSISQNISPEHLIDIKQVAMRRENMM